MGLMSLNVYISDRHTEVVLVLLLRDFWLSCGAVSEEQRSLSCLVFKILLDNLGLVESHTYATLGLVLLKVDFRL